MRFLEDRILSRDVSATRGDFWKTIEAFIDEEELNPIDREFRSPITEDELLEIVRSQHTDRSRYPEVIDLERQGRPMLGLGFVHLMAISSRGTERVVVWVLPLDQQPRA